MECNRGKIVSEGIAAARGKIVFCGDLWREIKRGMSLDIELEVSRYNAAVTSVCAELDKLYEKASIELGENGAEIFKAHKLLVCDEGYRKSVEDIIRNESVCAEYAVACTRDKYVAMFDDMGDGYLKARSADIRDISEHLISVLTAAADNMTTLTEPSIIVAKELTPSETIKLDRRLVLGFVMETAADNSHVAILARSMVVPMLTGVKVDKDWNGRIGAIDADNGYFYVEPDEEVSEKLRVAAEVYKKQKGQQKVVKNRQIVAKDGRKIMLCANVGSIEDVDAALEVGADGIGLFRTELLFLGREDYPTEEEQFEVYRCVAEKFKGKPVTIRTIDVGADKKADYMGLCHEDNPALGMRGIRLCLEKKDIFKTQLRAILRAAVYGKIAVMFPMITTVDEAFRVKALLCEAKAELKNEAYEYGEVELGVMIETPAAALISDELAELYDVNNPAVIKLIDMTIENAHARGIRVGVCGEAAATDIVFAKRLVDMGVEELSVSPVFFTKIRECLAHD
ncbi:MAG: phosphoenolpyruvate--protein phosphotransferase [Lachnospiraceae bacterium]|nr:phosphoenolpyruvate--protein phosphotransferase [Lachnospiraceae bacterium]